MDNRIAWHAFSLDELFRNLETKKEGLTHEEARLRLEKYGFNRLERKKEYRLFGILLKQFLNPFVLILAAAGLAAFFLGSTTDAVVIYIAIAINTAIGFLQEGKASKTFDRLNEQIARKTIVIREGREKEIPADMLVPGDIFIAEAGDWVSADARIIEMRLFKVNEAALTGEWIPVEKALGVVAKSARVTSRTNMVFAGTLVEQGRALLLAVATRMETELGKISLLVEQAKDPETPLEKGIARMARVIAIAVIAITAIIFTLGTVRGESVTQMFLTSVAISVASVPEGLPIVVTVILAIGMERILKKKGLVKNLLAAETLGSCDIILTDKTGTLTEAKMRVSHVVSAGETIENKGPEFYRALSDRAKSHLRACIAAVATSNAFIENPDDPIGEWKIRGEPMHRAIILSLAEAGIPVDELFLSRSHIDILPFDSERRFAASLVKEDDSTNTLFIAGAPELLLDMSSHVYENGTVRELMPSDRENLLRKQKAIISSGERMIASAYKETKESRIVCNQNTTPCIQGAVFLGLIGFHDPVRSDVPAAIHTAQGAGLRPIVVTGDHRLTAEHVAKEIGIPITGTNVLQGEELDMIDEKEFRKRVHEFDVYARVLPHQKMKIVEAWQSRGAVVAMTGDGVNDAPAIKKADVGVTVGSGTEVAKEASDLVLLNDSFSVIVAAIGEGRVIADNIRKSITLLLSTTFSEIVLIGGALVVGLPLPILPAQILWTNLIEEGFLSFAYAFEPEEGDVMKRSLRTKKTASIFTSEMLFLIFGVGLIASFYLFGVYLAMLYLGYSLEHIRTVAFAGVALDALFFIFSLRSLRRPIWKIPFFTNPVLLGAVGISVLFLFSALTLGPIQRLLTLTPLSFNFYLLILGLGILNLVSIEAAKWFFIRKKIAD